MAQRSFIGGVAGARQRRRLFSDKSGPRTLGGRVDEAAIQQAVLLREGDHRIKNSLQIVIALMRAQARRADNPLVTEALLGAAARVDAIARMHDALQQCAGADEIDIGSVIEMMCQSLQTMAGDARTIAVVVNVETICAPIALAQPILLAVNELVINALRHAFPGDRTGTVTVSAVQANGRLRFVVADDGVGLPAEHLAGPGYGMKLVNMMVGQIGGALDVETSNGTRFTLTAAAPKPSHEAFSAGADAYAPMAG